MNISIFEDIKQVDQKGVEYWMSRQLAKVLEYQDYRNFQNVISKAKEAIENSGEVIHNHIVDVTEMVPIGSGAERGLGNIKLDRYACYLIVQNSDPSKEVVALGQTYFAQQTRRQELQQLENKELKRVEARRKLTDSDKVLSGVAMSRNVTSQQLATIKSAGDKHLFGGHDTRDMKRKYKINNTAKPLADYLPTISLTAKQLANEMTAVNTESNDLHGFGKIGTEHISNNIEIRKSLIARGIKLENLPAEEDVKKVERRIKSAEKKNIKAKND
jgi:DNA-damage-inducible protein D